MDVYDCFMFYNELDLLELRLGELDGVVDRFVLVEATRTHRGNLKPLFYADNRERYRQFSDKIIHVVVDGLLEDTSAAGATWQNECLHRNGISRGLGGAKDDDLIVVSDVDEIPRPSMLAEKREGLFDMRLSYYYYNLVWPNSHWSGSIVSRLGMVKLNSPQGMRDMARFSNMPFLPQQGWHFSYLGNEEDIVVKLKSFCHAEMDVPKFTSAGMISRAIKDRRLFFNGISLETLPVADGTFPYYLAKNAAKFDKYILKEE